LARKNHASDRLDEERLTERVSVSIAVPSLKLLEYLMDAKTVLSLSSHLKYLQHGDQVEVEIEGLGKIMNKVVFTD
jgi:2-keto-4-pentenoate hydratase/2-oxohepta-3-ene-1,7-dioic acid hydratase in catechol pathway